MESEARSVSHHSPFSGKINDQLPGVGDFFFYAMTFPPGDLLEQLCERFVVSSVRAVGLKSSVPGP